MTQLEKRSVAAKHVLLEGVQDTSAGRQAGEMVGTAAPVCAENNDIRILKPDYTFFPFLKICF